MSSERFTILLVSLLVLAPTSGPAATSAFDLLVERTPQSLRGQTIDLDDRWQGARLLAHFGESKLGYDLLRERPPEEVVDYRVERFEARLLCEIGLYDRADSVLALQPYSGDLQTYYLLCLQRSRLNLLSGRYERALGYIGLIDTLKLSTFEPYRDYVAIETYMRMERFTDASRVGEERLARGIPVSMSPEFEELLLEAYIRDDQIDRAYGFVKVLKARSTKSRKMAPLLVREVDLLFAKADTTMAIEAAFDLTRDRRTRHLASEVIENVLDRVPAERLTNDALLEFSSVLLGKKQLGDAGRLIGVLKERSLDGGDRERRRLLVGDLYYRQRRYSKSYRQIRGKFADAALERRAMLLRARIYRRIGEPVKSAKAYSEFARVYPYDAKAPEALIVAADLYMRTNNRKQSLATLNRVVETYPSHNYARVATMKLAVYHLDRKQYDEGVAILEKSLEQAGRRSKELLFYLADAYERIGDEALRDKLLDELRMLDPVSFYLKPEVPASFVRPIIGSNGRIVLYGERGILPFLKDVFRTREAAYRAIRDMLPEVLPTDGHLDASGVYLERGRQFLQMGFRDWGEAELKVLEGSRRIPSRVWFELGVLYDDFAMHWKSVRAFQRVYYMFTQDKRDALDTYFKVLLYPLPYPAQILENCARNDIAPHLVYSMIREESRFDMNAVSRAGAMGLMQIMPETGEQVASELGYPRGVDDDLFVPEVNLTFGIWYASRLLERTNNDALMMAAAYNAGFGNARRWFDKDGDNGSVIMTVDGIDYRETRAYVKRIVRSSRVYHMYYFGAGARGGGER